MQALTQAMAASGAVRLRALKPDDAPVMALLANDADIARMTAQLPHPYQLADATRFIAFVAAGAEGDIIRAIEVDGVFAGVIGTNSTQGPRELGYWLGKAFWGRGIASTALRAFIALLRADGIAGDLTARVVTGNPASMRVLEKAGFRRHGGHVSCRTLASGGAALEAVAFVLDGKREGSAS